MATQTGDTVPGSGGQETAAVYAELSNPDVLGRLGAILELSYLREQADEGWYRDWYADKILAEVHEIRMFIATQRRVRDFGSLLSGAS